MREARINAWVSAAGLAASVALWFLIDVGISESSTFSGNSPMLTSRFFPRFTACLLGLSSFACLAGSVLRLHAGRTVVETAEAEPADANLAPEDNTVWSEFRVLGLLGLFVLYGVLFHPLGYLYSSIVVCTLTLVLLKCKKWKYYLVSWAFAGLIFLVFTRLLYVPLP